MSTVEVRSFDANEPAPWDRSPLPGGTRVSSAERHGNVVDAVRHNPHFPHPDIVSGALIVDPDILLKAKGFDLEINFFYNSRSSINSAFGKKRSISPNCYVAKDDGGLVQVIRGDEKAYEFTAGSTSGFTTTYSGVAGQYAGTALIFNSDLDAFVETFPDGKKMVYDKNQGGSPVRYAVGRVEDPSGNRQTFSYGSNPETNLLKSIEVPGGRLVTFAYTAGGSPTSLLDHIEDWSGRRWTMQYDGNRQLTTMTTPTGCTTKYLYTSGILTTIEDPRGYATTYAYDGANRVASVAAGSGVWTYAYGGPMTWSGSQRTDPSGAITTYLLGAVGISNVIHPEGYTTSYVYDANGYQTKQIEPYGTISSVSYNGSGLPLVAFDALGYITTYQYDASLNLTTMTDALGNVWSFTYDGNRRRTASIDPLGQRTTFAWNSDGTLLSSQDGRGLFTTHAYDAFGNLASTIYSYGAVVTYGYDELGRRTGVLQPGESVAMSYIYDAGDNLVAEVNLNGARTTYVWDSCLMVAVANPLNERVTYTYNRFGSQATVMNPLGFVTSFGYDSMNRQVSVQDAAGNNSTTVYLLNQRVADIDALSHRTTYTYDFANRLTGTQDARGNTWTSVYDNRQLVAKMDPEGSLTTAIFDGVGQRVATVSPLGIRGTMIYDAARQLAATVDGLSRRTSYSYDAAGNLTQSQNARGKVITTSYLANRNLAEETIDAMGFVTTYSYDLQDRLVSTRDANGGYVTNTYDAVGRLQSVLNQLSESSLQYGYDLANRVVTMADASGRVRTFTYDAAGQELTKQFPDGTIATFLYDRIGLVTTMVDWGGSTTYSYDGNRRISGQTDAAGFVQIYATDSNGNRTGLNLVGTGLFTYTYDALNRLTECIRPGNDRYTLQYDKDSRRTTMLLGLGSRRQYQYDSANQLTTQIELNASNIQICTIIDGYDLVGNRVGRNLDGNAITWTYDDNDRLTGQLKLGQVCTYTMDGVGNLKTMWEGGNFPKTFTFDLAHKLVTMVHGAELTTYAYTGFGALEVEHTGTALATYSYSGQDQLVHISTPNGFPSTYTFGGDGLRRTAQEGNVQATTMVWDGDNYLLLNEPGGDRVVLTLDSEVVACGNRDLLTDPLGTLVKEITAGASLQGLVELFPYGSEVGSSARPRTPFVYLAAYGYFRDSSGRDYVRARELLKAAGRWMQEDPLWPSELPYAYVGNNPISRADPSGEKDDPCKPGGSDRTKPPDCSKCGPGCKAVYLTCNPNAKDRTAVYCLPDDICIDTDGSQVRCCDLCRKYGKELGTPAFPRGSYICIHGLHGAQTRKINDCGCGQKVKNKPKPDEWIDFEVSAGDCKKFKDGWRCVCPGKCK